MGLLDVDLMDGFTGHTSHREGVVRNTCPLKRPFKRTKEKEGMKAKTYTIRLLLLSLAACVVGCNSMVITTAEKDDGTVEKEIK